MKRFLLIITLVFSSIQAYSQVHIGLSSGAAITNLKHKEDWVYSYSSQTRFNIGVPVFFKVNEHIGFESGMSYINMGSKLTYNAIDPDDPIYDPLKGTYSFRLNYLSVPLTFNYTIPISKYSIYAKAGGYISFALNSKIKDNQSDKISKLDLDDEKIKKTDLGILIGLGITRELGNGFLFFDARYMIGCSNLTSEKYFNTTTSNAYNRGLLLNIGYIFNLKKS